MNETTLKTTFKSKLNYKKYIIKNDKDIRILAIINLVPIILSIIWIIYLFVGNYFFPLYEYLIWIFILLYFKTNEWFNYSFKTIFDISGDIDFFEDEEKDNKLVMMFSSAVKNEEKEIYECAILSIYIDDIKYIEYKKDTKLIKIYYSEAYVALMNVGLKESEINNDTYVLENKDAVLYDVYDKSLLDKLIDLKIKVEYI